MKKIYQIVFIISVLFFIGEQENLVFGQSEIVKMLEGKIATCGLVINESINKTDTTNQVIEDTTKVVQIRYTCRAVSYLVTDKPLYVIDGIPQENDSTFKNLSPEDIEAIFVMKGASAVAIWGSRGGHSVILITLKKKEVKEEKVEKPVEEIVINVFPNPTSNFVNIALNLKEKSEVEVKIYNLQTLESFEVVKEEYEAGKQIINYKTDFLKNGIYTLKIRFGNQIIERKLVIEN